MRSCVYCGRELEKGEYCTCPQAVARRSEKEAESNRASANQNNDFNNGGNSYHTGYTAHDNAVKYKWEKRRAKYTARKNAKNAARAERARQKEAYYGGYGNYDCRTGFWKSLWQLIVQFIKSPIGTISNPGHIAMSTALVLSMISGAIINLCLYFLRTGAVRTPFGIVLSLITLNPLKSYSNLLYIFLNMLSGAVMGLMIFFIYTGIFYAISRFIFKHTIMFKEFAPRFSLTALPVAMTSVIGILFGFFSSTSLAILIICGIIGFVIVTYEGLRTEWISHSQGKVMYAMMLGFFIFTTVICYIMRLSV